MRPVRPARATEPRAHCCSPELYELNGIDEANAEAQIAGERTTPWQRRPRQPAAAPAAVYEVARMMTQVTERGTGRAVGARLKITLPAKTGTSSDLRDSWFAGFTGSHVAVSWVGYDDNQATGLTGSLNSLAKIGIDTTGDNDLLTLEDEAALDDAIANNLAGLKLLFNDPTKGIATQLNTYLDKTIGEEGSLVTRQDALTKQSSEIDTQITDMEKRVQTNRQRLIDRKASLSSPAEAGHYALDPLAQRRPLDQLHHERLETLALLEPVDARDVGVIQCREGLGLALETRHALRV